MYDFSKDEIAAKIKKKSTVQSNGCWLNTHNAPKLSTMTPDGAQYSRTFRQWGYWFQTGIDLYKSNKRMKMPVCKNKNCINPDHQNLNLECTSKPKEMCENICS